MLIAYDSFSSQRLLFEIITRDRRECLPVTTTQRQLTVTLIGLITKLVHHSGSTLVTFYRETGNTIQLRQVWS